MRRAYAAFFAVLVTFTAVCWLLVGSFLVGDLPAGWRTLAGAWAISLAPAFVLVANVLRGGYPSAFLRLTLFRLFWYSQLAVVMLVPVAVAAFLVGAPFGAGASAGRLAILVAIPVEIVAALWGYAGTRRLVVTRVDAAMPDLPAGLDGLRIVQLSDLHVGPHTSARHLRRIADATQRAEPHLIAYTGDQVDDYPRDMEVLASHFGHLSAPLGVFAIPGNHDVYAGWRGVRAGLEGMGVTVLVNRAMKLRYNGAEFWLAGTGDPAAGQMAWAGAELPAPDIAGTLANIPAGAFRIVLAHNPALFPALAAGGVPLTLSGHTHHGQLAIPALRWCLASLFTPYAMGAYERGGSLLYVTAGANYWGIPFRLGAPSEILVVTLRSGSGAPMIRAAIDVSGAEFRGPQSTLV